MLLLVLAAVLLAQGAAWRAGHRTRDELWSDARSDGARERIWALHILSQRDRPSGIDAALVGELLAAPEPALREFALTQRFRRFGARDTQRRHLDAAQLSAEERTRSRFFFRGHGQVDRKALRAYLDALP